MGRKQLERREGTFIIRNYSHPPPFLSNGQLTTGRPTSLPNSLPDFTRSRLCPVDSHAWRRRSAFPECGRTVLQRGARRLAGVLDTLCGGSGSICCFLRYGNRALSNLFPSESNGSGLRGLNRPRQEQLRPPELERFLSASQTSSRTSPRRVTGESCPIPPHARLNPLLRYLTHKLKCRLS